MQSVEHWESWSGKWFVSSNIEYTEPLDLPPEFVLFGDSHSHGELSAYASHTDKNDELYKDGLHIVAGHVDRWLGDLPEKYLDVIVRRFGLRGHDVTTLEEVGKAIGLTRERVRQIQVDALRELKAQLAAEGFEQGAVI